MQVATIKKYGWVNALRGYAILMVIMIHVSQHFEPASTQAKSLAALGDLGVPLFFIASSFTLFNSFEKRGKLGEQSIVKHFFIRRFFRIAPYYYLAGLGYIAFAIFIKHEQVSIIKILSNYTFTNGIYLPAINYIPPGGWSIGVEMLFYLLIPTLYKLIRSLKLAVAYLLASVSLSASIGFIAYAIVTNLTNHSWNALRGWSLYFWLPNQLPVFLFGIVLYFLWKSASISNKLSSLMLLVSVGAFLGLSQVQFPLFVLQREYVYAAIFTLFALAISARGENSLWCTSPIQRIGTVSFSMYLNHFMIITAASFSARKIGILNTTGSQSDIAFIIAYSGIVAITFFLSCLTYRHIEAKGVAAGESIIKTIKP